MLANYVETAWKLCFWHSYFSDFFIVYQISEVGSWTVCVCIYMSVPDQTGFSLFCSRVRIT